MIDAATNAGLLWLDGCSPVPLANYLKALAVHRLVAEQRDTTARACWDGERFGLLTGIGGRALLDYFLYDYQPSPILAPWNGGSGFNANDKRQFAALQAVLTSDAPRFLPYAVAIKSAFDVLAKLGIAGKPEDRKAELIDACRGQLPDRALDWLDAVVVVTESGPGYPPLLGTGGNDGRLEFTNNFMQRLAELFDMQSGQPLATAESQLKAALFDSPTQQLLKDRAIGQFQPGNAGGVNSSTGYDSNSLINPWDYVLMMEGALLFAASATKKLETGKAGALAYPFSVRSVGAGYESAAASDEGNSRAELWLPLWEAPASLDELRYLFSEGRAQIGRRSARNGVDFARAIAALGVDRGIERFHRYGFQVRNGLSYFATPLGRFDVRRRGEVDLLNEIDAWLDRFRRTASADRAPASLRRALNELDGAILRVCQVGGADRTRAVFAALGRCERQMAKSLRYVTGAGLSPCPGLSPGWLRSSGSTPELRLAAALASLYVRRERTPLYALRHNLEPVELRRRNNQLQPAFLETVGPSVVWSPGDVVTTLSDILERRLIDAVSAGSRAYDDRSRMGCDLYDVEAFIAGEIDDRLFADLLWACCLIDWSGDFDEPMAGQTEADELIPDALYGVLKLCFTPRWPDGGEIPIVLEIIRRGRAGEGGAATRLATRRLRASGVPTFTGAIARSGDTVRRATAALLFPVDAMSVRRLERKLVRRNEMAAVSGTLR